MLNIPRNIATIASGTRFSKVIAAISVAAVVLATAIVVVFGAPRMGQGWIYPAIVSAIGVAAAAMVLHLCANGVASRIADGEEHRDSPAFADEWLVHPSTWVPTIKSAGGSHFRLWKGLMAGSAIFVIWMEWQLSKTLAEASQAQSPLTSTIFAFMVSILFIPLMVTMMSTTTALNTNSAEEQ